MKSISIHICIFFLILTCVSSTGCIKLVQKNQDQSVAPQNTDNPSASSIQTSVSSPLPITTSPTFRDTPVNAVEIVDPILPDEYYRTIRNLSERDGEVPSPLLRSSFTSRIPLYHLKYSPKFNATAIRVNVTHGPLVVTYKVSFKLKDPRISFAIITVRDFLTKEIITEERAEQVPTEEDIKIDKVKQIVVPREGIFHINVYGNQCDVDLSVYSGDTPIMSGSSAGSIPQQPTGAENLDLG